MTASPIKKAALAVTFASLLWAGTASAQTAPGTETQPQTLPAPGQVAPAVTAAPPVADAPPRTLAPRRLDAPANPAGQPTSPAPTFETPKNAGPAVQVDQLGTLDPDSAGTLTGANGGFAPDLWKDLDRPVADNLFARLPETFQSPTLRNLVRGMMLSAAQPPAGDSAPGSFVGLRANTLMDMGYTADVTELISATPRGSQNAVLSRLSTEAQFLAGQHADACASAAGNLQNGGVFWQKAVIFCQTLAGQFDKATLGLSLLEELDSGDRLFIDLIYAMGEDTGGTLEATLPPTPLHIAIARAAKVHLDGENARSVFSPVLALETSDTQEDRLSAALQAETLGLLPSRDVRQLFLDTDFAEDSLTDPLAQIGQLEPPAALGLLYKAAARQRAQPIVQTELVDAAVRLAKDSGLILPTARIFAPIVAGLPVSPDLLWFAPNAVRVMLGANDIAVATRWYNMLRNSALGDPTGAALLQDVQALGWIAGLVVDEQLTLGSFRDWRNSRLPEDDPARLSSRMLALLDGTGGAVAPEIWTELLGDPAELSSSLPGLATWRKLAGAGQDKNVGEAILLMNIGFAEGPLADTHPLFTNAVLSTLRSLGLERDARRLAVEIALTANL